jgi:hypothetical protein
MTNYSGVQAVHATSVTPEEDARTIALNRVSWGGVLAGVVVALVVQLLINMLGIGIGVATLDPGTNDNPTAWLGGRSGTVITTVTGLGLRASARRLP